MVTKERTERGRRARTSGRDFELKVRKDLEKKGWFVCKWANDVKFGEGDVIIDTMTMDSSKGIIGTALCNSGKIVPAKRQFNPFTKFMSIGNGVPDFICHRRPDTSIGKVYEVIAVESKSTGYPSKEEKEKYDFYLANKVFSEILIASKGKKRGEIVYKKYEKK